MAGAVLWIDTIFNHCLKLEYCLLSQRLLSTVGYDVGYMAEVIILTHNTVEERPDKSITV